MSIKTVLLPLFVDVLLTFGLLFWMASLRVPALNRGEVKPKDVALREPNWPRKTLQVQWAYHNQLELPLLFYILTILAWITRFADLLFVVMAWIFVVSRLLRAYIHVTSNNLRLRGSLFGLGAVVLLLMWLIFMVRLLSVPG